MPGLSRTFQTTRWILLTLACFWTQGACDRPTPTPKTSPRLIILGVDGMDHALTRQMIEEGQLPNLSSLHFAPLATTFPPQSPVAWSSFITGENPGGHGIFDFVHRDKDTLSPYLSSSRLVPSKRTLDLFGYRLPLDAPRLENLRKGDPFWLQLSKHGVSSEIIKLPANFPPEPCEHMRALSGMGVPDLLGGYGEFTLFTPSDFVLRPGLAGGRIARLTPEGTGWSGKIEGPPDPIRTVPETLTLPIRLEAPSNGPLRITIADGTPLEVTLGGWSEWVPIQFDLLWGLSGIPGMVRFQYLSPPPDLRVYMSPINLDPMDPAIPVSWPPEFSAEIAERVGRYFTQGIPEDTKALAWGVWSHEDYLKQVLMIFEEEKRLLNDRLKSWMAAPEGGLIFFYFSVIDQASHIFWSIADERHPNHNPELALRYSAVVTDLYREMDAIVERVRAVAGKDTPLIVMSDHGFSGLYRTVDVNRWLEQEGYLKLKASIPGETLLLADGVDWTQTQAYSIGFNAIYANIKGREPLGTVEPDEAEKMLRTLSGKLLAFNDPANGQPVFSAVPLATSEYGQAIPDGPDLLLGYTPLYSSSWLTAAGEIGGEVIEDNRDTWISGHNVDPQFVPGVLLSTLPIPERVLGLEQMAAWIESFYLAAP